MYFVLLEFNVKPREGSFFKNLKPSADLMQKLPLLNKILLKNFHETEYSIRATSQERLQGMVDVVVALLQAITKYTPLLILIGDAHLQKKNDCMLTDAICSRIQTNQLSRVHLIMTAEPLDDPVYTRLRQSDHTTQFLDRISKNKEMIFSVQPYDRGQTMLLLMNVFDAFSIHADVMKLVMTKCGGMPGTMYVPMFVQQTFS